ncbi:UrcA family protein [uncultured Pseudoteredinibacter sp.]|uniref:UrcA family protein n=1 Tax=uncultured Pseudoteredinibacter sp. TaxID=1641701 RepID=UPI00260815FD|nr:UrcA family protein [uncultured Pseudoteredinibacter sp.]
MKNHSKKIALVTATVSALFLASGAHAIVGKSTQQEVVIFSDLNVAEMKDQLALEKRVRNAAEKVCGVEQAEKSRSFSIIADSKRCYQESIEAAMKTVELAAR